MTDPQGEWKSPAPWPRRLKILALIVIVVGVALDLSTKVWLGDLLALDPGTRGPFGRIEIIPGFFALEGTYNPGVTFGLAQGETLPILVFTFLATAVLGGWLFLTRRPSRLLHIALGMVLAGALGNLWDRLHWHKVRDFFLFYVGEYEWPNFNVADSMIVVGVSLILLDELILSRLRARKAAVRGTTASS